VTGETARSGLDLIGWYIATLHQLIGHDAAAASIGAPAGGKDSCVICRYESDPTQARREAVYAALAADPAGHDPATR
jgi:hypothetical protein